MENTIIGIIGVVISGVTLLVMLFGIQLGKKAMFKNQTVFGKEAVDWYNAIQNKLKTADLFLDEEYKGGNKSTPQFEMERFHFDNETMPSEWKKYKKVIHRYYRKDENKRDDPIMVQGWRL